MRGDVPDAVPSPDPLPLKGRVLIANALVVSVQALGGMLGQEHLDRRPGFFSVTEDHVVVGLGRLEIGPLRLGYVHASGTTRGFPELSKPLSDDEVTGFGPTRGPQSRTDVAVVLAEPLVFVPVHSDADLERLAKVALRTDTDSFGA